MEAKVIPNTNNKYLIFEDGTVFSLFTYKPLKNEIGQGGYPSVVLMGDDGKQHHYYIHRLLAEAFIENPHKYRYINHKDEDKTNYALDNLEWCTQSYNMTYNEVNKHISKKLKGRTAPNKGVPMSEAQKKKISESCKGRKFKETNI